MMNSELHSYTITVYELMQMQKEGKFDFGLQDYEIHLEEYRNVLNNAILEHYKFREIGFTNAWLWRDRLNTRMNRIMRDKYAKLYKAKSIEFNPLFNIDITEEFKHNVEHQGTEKSTAKNNGTSTSTSESNSSDSSKSDSDNLALSSSYPSEEMTDGDFESNVYVDNGAKSTNSDKTTSSSNEKLSANGESFNNMNSEGESKNNTVESYIKKTEGSSAGLPFSKALIQLKQFYDSYKLDEQIIDELKDLFMTVW